MTQPLHSDNTALSRPSIQSMAKPAEALASCEAADAITLTLEIVSDTICPWCYIGKRRLERAEQMLRQDVTIVKRWRPFELNPDMPAGGIDRLTYRMRKFGSEERSLALDAQVREAGAGEGVQINHERIDRTPNTLASHALTRLADEYACQDALVEALFAAYFTEGRDIGDPAVLKSVGLQVGLDATRIDAALDDPLLRKQIHRQAQAYARAGINSVPSFLINGRLWLSGAQPPAMMARGLTEALALRMHDVSSPGS